MKILVIGPSWVGDMVMSQSLYIELKNQYPNASIDVLAPRWCGPILERMPQVDNALEMPIGHGDFDLIGRWRLGRSLAVNQYTHAYVLPNSAKSALIPLFAGIPKRIGWKGEMRFGLLNDLRPNKRIFQYMVERYVALAFSKAEMKVKTTLDTCPHPSLTVSRENQSKLINKLDLNTEREIIGICPGAEFGPSKRWPDEYYAELTASLINQGKQVWMFGSTKDQEVTNKIRMSLPEEQRGFCYNLAGETSLIEAIDLLAMCKTVFCNDSGLMHISAAVGSQIVAIYGSTSPLYTPPLSDKVVIVSKELECRPCFKRECPLGHLKCLKDLSVSTIINHYNSMEQDK
ncbi:lipopolysaccharide heptosyltransferase II [Vibrio viridaestus]|uniref:lipopolysaccharide heptosyltransferase II n=1 Tax=Vibrio viridaestus TaxID=2487322 RepID=A0A3N9TDY4_9VIBR|nr:lipopolysaccharide heptosyltransferase II [Vibrio viridaestus]RQW61725.1 lipopolysaccharide heptosyltransferase II [Vibrio viridaestus]